MYYEPGGISHNLPFNPLKSCIVPRPIAWISTVSASGAVNLAPFSQCNIVGWDPPYVMFSAFTRPGGIRKDSVANAEATGEFVFNMATYALRDAVVATSIIEVSGVNEMEAAGLTVAPARRVAPPLVAESPVNLECKFVRTVELPSTTPGMFNSLVIGEVVGIHIKDAMLTEGGKLDIERIQPLARMGYLDYAVVREVFELRPEGISDRMIEGLSGGAIPLSKG
ncbi:MAG: flavin reductase family protein [Rhizobiaceae bacterium]